MSSPDFPLLTGFYQLAYVVEDIDRTVAQLRGMGVSEIQVTHNQVRPGSSGTIKHSAKAWVGEVMLEIIEPMRDRPSLYEAPLPEGQGAFLHHLGCDIADAAEWRAVCGTLEGQRLKVSVKNTLPGVLDYAYTDLRPETGAFVEHVHLLDKAFYDEVPHNPPGSEQGRRPLLDGFFQIAFVTADLEAAMAVFAERFGVDFEVRQDTAGAPVLRVATGRTEKVMLELIEPDPASPSTYSQLLPQDGLAAVHHIAMLVKDAAEMARVEEALAFAGLPVVRRNETAISRSLHADARKALGHFLEYVELRV
jgi:hypothetical protein